MSANSTSLRFKDKLVGRQTSTDSLLKKLKALHQELTEHDPDEFQVESLAQVRTDLVHRSILFHKDPGVKAYAACCIADILKYYAPDAPYDSQGIRDIFAFILDLLSTQLRPSKSSAASANRAASAHPTKNEFYKQYFYLLESLANCKSVILMLDAEEGGEDGQAAFEGEESLVARTFKEFFDLVRFDLPRTLTDHMTDILTTLIDESHAVSSQIRQLLLDQFDTDRPAHHPKTLELAVSVCEFEYTFQKLERSFAQYFLEILLQNNFGETEGSRRPRGSSISSDDSSSSEPPTPVRGSAKKKTTASSSIRRQSSKDLINATHALIRSISFHAPFILLSTLPVLEAELENTDTFHRTLAVESLGRLFGGQKGGEIAGQAPKTWRFWVERSKDADAKVRRIWVEQVGKMMSATGFWTGLKEELEPRLRVKLRDPEEKVREMACRILGQLDYETTLHHIDRETLETLALRFGDKRPSVCAAAIHSMAKLYSLAVSEIDDNDPQAIHLFGWIPNEIIKRVAGCNPTVREIIEQSLLTHIVPLPPKGDEEGLWVDRLLSVMRRLDEASKQILLVVGGLNSQRVYFTHFINACERNNGGTIDQEEEKVKKVLARTMQTVSRFYNDPSKATNDLQEFADANENRLYKLIRLAMDPQTDLKTLVKVNAEFAKRCPPSILPTMSTLLRRASFPLINRSSISTLLKRLRPPPTAGTATEASKAAAADARTILVRISKICPLMYKSHTAELGKAILDESLADGEGVREAWGAGMGAVPLQAFAHVQKADQSVQTSDKKVLDRAIHLALHGSPKEAKYAVRLISYSKKADALLPDLAESLANALANDDPAELHRHLAALAELASSGPVAFETQSSTIVEFILTTFAKHDPDNDNDGDEWVADEDLTERARAKLIGLKLLANRCATYVDTPAETATTVATPVLKLFLTILTQKGYYASRADGCNTKTRVRLQAARSLLKLSAFKVYSDLIAPSFLVLAVLVQDPCFYVREQFIRRLCDALLQQKVPTTYNVMLYLSAHDEEEIRTLASNTIQKCMNQMAPDQRFRDFYNSFVRLIHLLAHHPDYENEPEDLQSIARYIEFYLDIVMKKDVVSLLYSLAGKVKTIRDRDNAYSENLYTVAELSQHIIQARCKTHHWTIENWPGHVKMPSDLFKPLHDPEAVQRNIIKQYLPDETLQAFRTSLGKKVKDPPKPRAKKAAAAATPKKTPVKRKKRASTGSTKKVRTSHAADKWSGGETTDEDAHASSDSSALTDDDNESLPEKKKPAAAVPSKKRKKEDSGSDQEDKVEGEEKLGRGPRTRARQEEEDEGK